MNLYNKNGLKLGFNWVGGYDDFKEGSWESSKTSAVLASYHNPKSITWRWALYWIKSDTLLYSYRKLPEINTYQFAIPFVGGLSLCTQPNMFRQEKL